MTNGSDSVNPISPELGNIEYGLTKRELFAAMAMQGILSSRHDSFNDYGISYYARMHADALIAELNKEVQS